jgi:hypothetical protein
MQNNYILEKIKQSAFEYYRKNGYPYVKLSDHEIWAGFDKLLSFKSSGVLHKIQNNLGLIDNHKYTEGLQSNVGQIICQMFMPHQIEVKAVNSPRTPLQSFNDDKLLNRIFELILEEGKEINDSQVRSKSRIVFFTQFASNFRPSFAKQIYSYFCKEGLIYDFSSGFGGRLLGFIASNWQNKNKKYIAVEPSTKTYDGLNQMSNFFSMQNLVEIHKIGSELFCPKKYHGKIDLAFSSPPYFNKEKYSDEETQSCNKFAKYEDWKEKFLFTTIENTYRMLKRGGLFCINIDDVQFGKNKYPLINDCANFAESIFSERMQDFYFPLSYFGNKKTGIEKKNYEVFMLWKK